MYGRFAAENMVLGLGWLLIPCDVYLLVLALYERFQCRWGISTYSSVAFNFRAFAHIADFENDGCCTFFSEIRALICFGGR